MGETVSVRVTPKASREKVEVVGEGVKVWVSAPPVDGEANRAVVAVLAKALKVAKGRVEIVRGESGREKMVRVEGMTGDEVLAALRG